MAWVNEREWNLINRQVFSEMCSDWSFIEALFNRRVQENAKHRGLRPVLEPPQSKMSIP